MRTIVLIAASLVCLLALACQNTSTNRETTAANTAPATASPAMSPMMSPMNMLAGDKIGVAECDQFLEAYETCVASKVPAAARAQYKAALAQWRTSWHTLASNPQTKAQLTQACKTQMESARTSMKTYGCTF